jgi:hypothetical protein
VTADTVALAHYRSRKRLVEAIADEAQQAWRSVTVTDLVGSWRAAAAPLLVGLAGAQLAAAQDSDTYLDTVLDEQGIDPAAEGATNARALAGVASDGRDLDTLLDRPMIATLAAIGEGASTALALATGYATLDMIVRTQVADAGRIADLVGTCGRPRAGGYTRMVVGKTCGRCIVLAGRWYRYDAGFNRHPRCDCVGIPSREAIAGDVQLDPRRAFDAMTRGEQDKAFTKAGAEAIRLGADPAQVVNARRGANGLSPAGARITAAEARALREGRDIGRLRTTRIHGQDVFVTTEGATTRGVAGRRLGARETGVKVKDQRYRVSRTPRLMPESILQAAEGNRGEAIRLLKRFGYITA